MGTRTTWHYIEVESAASLMRAVASRALAQALVDGIDNAKEEGRPLTQLQQIDLATMTVMAYGSILDAAEAVEASAMIDEAAVLARARRR